MKRGEKGYWEAYCQVCESCACDKCLKINKVAYVPTHFILDGGGDMGEPTLKDIPTCDLVNELTNREGVETHTIPAHNQAEMTIQTTSIGATVKVLKDAGPAFILVVVD